MTTVAAPAAKTVVVMQPYLFPYLPYYQLARAADEFVFLDDAAFIKQGFVHRNNILLGDKPHRFTAPVQDIDSFRTIAQHRYVGDWAPLCALLRAAYHRAPRWRAAWPLVEAVLRDPDDNVAAKNMRSIRVVHEYLGIAAPRWTRSSALDPACALRGQARVLALCRATGAAAYVNAPGGRTLYAADAFEAIGLSLRFVQSRATPYAQSRPDFVPGLSMLDALMYCEPEEIVHRLAEFDLVA
jgi:hypothetical protein